MKLHDRINAFSLLGAALSGLSPSEIHSGDRRLKRIGEAVGKACKQNNWFTTESVYQAISAIAGRMLRKDKLERWLAGYPGIPDQSEPAKKVGIIMAGNLPLVGFHDFLCVLVSGYKAVVKVSAKDSILPQIIAGLLCDIEPRFGQLIEFTDRQPTGVNAAIATGSNNSARYFQSWYGNIPHIIRRNRNSVAILTGNETPGELNLLGKDIFSYYGLGCRNVSSLFVPRNYNFDALLKSLAGYSFVSGLKNYHDCYRYQKAVMTLNGENFTDNGFALLTEKPELYSPISVINYQFYDSLADVEQFILMHADALQCVVAGEKLFTNAVYFGDTQRPGLRDYADNIDTMNFLAGI